MSNIDWVECCYPLPDKQAQDLTFLTKSLGGLQQSYLVSEQGFLLLPCYGKSLKFYGNINLIWHGKVQIYGRETPEQKEWFCYDLDFVKGQLENITIGTRL